MTDTPAPTNPFCWVEIYTADLQRARRFYEAVLQVELSPMPSPKPGLEMLAFPMEVTRYGAGGALARMEGVSPGTGGTLIYFGCADCAAAAARVAAAGGKVIADKFSIGEFGFIAIIEDSEGNTIGLHSES